MEATDWRASMDNTFRRHMLNNVIMRTLREYSQNSESPSVNSTIKELSVKFEQKTFEVATSKDDYLARIHRKMTQARSKPINFLAPSTTGNQMTSTIIQRPSDSYSGQENFDGSGNQMRSTIIQRPADSYSGQENFDGSSLPLQKQNMLPTHSQSSINPMGTSLTSMSQTDVTTQPVLNRFDQDWQFGQQNVSGQRDLQHLSVYQQSMFNEPLGTSSSMLNMDGRQRSVGASFHQVSNGQAPQMLHQVSSKQLLHPIVNSQEQRSRFQDSSRLEGSQIPATYLNSQNLIGENKYISQSQMGVAKAPSAILPSLDTGTTSITDWHDPITQFQCKRSTYLPLLLKMRKKAEDHRPHARHALAVIGRMINFLNLTDREVMAFRREKLVHFMNQIIRFVNSIHKSIYGNQAVQISSSHGQHLSHNTPVNTTFTRKSTVSSLSTDSGCSYSQSSATDSLLYGSRNTTPQTEIQTLQHQGRGDSADQNVLKFKQNRKPMQSSSMSQAPVETLLLGEPQKLLEEKDNFMDLILQPSTKATSRSRKKKFSRGQISGSSSCSLLSSIPPEGQPLSSKVPQPSSLPISQIIDTSHVLNSGATSEHENSMLRFDTPMTPQTPSSMPKNIWKPAEPLSQVSSPRENLDSQTGVSNGETEVQEQSTSLATPGISVGTLQSDLADSESKQLSDSEEEPFEHLMKVIQSMSRETLTSSINDIVSVLESADRSPELANDDESEQAILADMENFLWYSTQAMDGNSDEQLPVNNLKRDLSSISKNASMTLDNEPCYLSYSAANLCAKKRRNESNHELVEEIRKVNDRLMETVIEVVSGSSKDTGIPDKGTIVRCTYKSVAISEEFKKLFASAAALAPLTIEFIVPSDYPNSPPQILEDLTEDYSLETENIMDKVKSRFNRCIRALQHPILVGEMAKAWDESARSTVSDFCLSVGGETFSSKYGTWECVSAAG